MTASEFVSSSASSGVPVVDVDELCRVHLPLVHFEVRAISSRLPGHVYTDDLVSAGMAALAMATRHADPRGVDTAGKLTALTTLPSSR